MTSSSPSYVATSEAAPDPDGLWSCARERGGGQSVEPGGAEQRDGENGKGVGAEAVAERPADKSAGQSERDQNAGGQPGLRRDTDGRNMGGESRQIDHGKKRQQGCAHGSRRRLDQDQIDQHRRPRHPNECGGGADTAPAVRSRPAVMANVLRLPRRAPRRIATITAANASTMTPVATRTCRGSLWRKANNPSGRPSRLPPASRSSSRGATARHIRGSTTIESTELTIMTSWTARAGSTTSRNSGVATTAKPKPPAA